MQGNVKATEEQVAYAKLLDLGMKVGLAALVLTFAIYLTGILPSHTPVNDLPKYWKMPVKQYLVETRIDRHSAEYAQIPAQPPELRKDYLKETNIHPGWSWLHRVDKGDFLNFLPIVFLAAITVICYIRIIPIFLAKKDMVYSLLAITEVVVLTLAASGYLGSGGH
ncbi:MAG: hypothetical protein ACYC9Y_11200 [Candidatus Methylomirabilia bacterium]